MSQKTGRGNHFRTVDGISSPLKYSPGKSNLRGYRSEAVFCTDDPDPGFIDVLNYSSDFDSSDSDYYDPDLVSEEEIELWEIDSLTPSLDRIRSTISSERFVLLNYHFS